MSLDHDHDHDHGPGAHEHGTHEHPVPPRAGRALRIGIGGPVGSGKTALVAALCRALRDEINLAVVTNDIYTTEDADFLQRAGRARRRPDHPRPHRLLPAHRDPRRHRGQPGRGRGPGGAVRRARPGAGGERRRQPHRDVLARPGRPADLRARRVRRRQGAAQGRPRRHVLRPAGDQQDRSRAAGRGVARGHGAGRRRGARGAAGDLHFAARGSAGGRGRRLGAGRAPVTVLPLSPNGR